jgi:hypothetical protein
MKAIAALPAFVAVAGLGIGWFAAPPLPAPDADDPSAQPPQALHAGASVEEAARRFGAYDVAEPEPIPTELAEAAPPPPDIADQFRRDLTAVVAVGDAQGAWIVDESTAERRRLLRSGDVYKEGWRVRGITAQSITLRKGEERREIRVTDVVPDILLASAPPAAAQTIDLQQLAAMAGPAFMAGGGAGNVQTAEAPMMQSEVPILPRPGGERQRYRSAGERRILLRAPGRGT